MINTVLLSGPISKKGTPSAGGYESSNRRTSDGLRELGINVIELPNKICNNKILGYVGGMLYTIYRSLTIKTTSSKTVFHITALYKQFLYYELLLWGISRLRGYKYVYDIRAGSIVIHYNERSFLYRYFFRFILRHSDLVLSEGMENMSFIKSISGKGAKYFPNYISPQKDEIKLPSAPQKTINLCYWGRLVPEKGIELTIDVCAYINRSDIQCELHIVGDGPKFFINEIHQKANDLKISDRVHFYGAQSSEKQLNFMTKMHFFIFPTIFRGEGHSNSLTEAMYFGVVPICSRNGFNQSVVSNAGVVLDRDVTFVEYGNAVISIFNKKTWSNYSLQSHTRVIEHFLSTKVLPKLLQDYHQINIFKK